MAYVRCDVASFEGFRFQQIGEMFPRVDVSPQGGWVYSDCNPDGSVFVATSVGQRMELGARQPNNPAVPRFQTDNNFHLYMVALTADGQGVFGRHLIFDAAGYYVREEPHFDADMGLAMGVLDVTVDGVILWWNGNNSRMVDGLQLLNWRERGDYIVGVLAHTWLGISVFEKPSKRWYRAFVSDVQLLPGIADDGTVAAQGEGGGFIPRSTWVGAPFDPHDVPDVTEPPVITKHPQSVTIEQGDLTTLAVEATGTEPLHYAWYASDSPDVVGDDRPTYTTPELEETVEIWVVVWNEAGEVTSERATVTVTVPIDPPDPVEPEMKHALISFDPKKPFAIEVLEQPHQDGAPNIALQHATTKQWLTVDDVPELSLSWRDEHETPGAWQRFIPGPGGYGAKRESGNRVVVRFGPWEEKEP